MVQQEITRDGRTGKWNMIAESSGICNMLTDIHVDVTEVRPHMAQQGTGLPGQSLGQN